MKRQQARKTIITVSFLLFPVIYYYLSPYVIIRAAGENTVNGSFLSFGLMFLSSLFLGRAYCGWVCSPGGFQEVCFKLNNRAARGGRWNVTKYFIWVPWLAVVALTAIRAGGYRHVDPFYATWHGVSMHDVPSVVIGLGVALVIFVLALTTGRRGFCHYGCWMAPFMILGRKLANGLRLPGLRLAADQSRCTDCLACTRNCPKSLNVNQLVRRNRMEDSECILCATCIDGCPRKAIHYEFVRPKRGDRQ
jgi:ferredoxin-type protein NapH